MTSNSASNAWRHPKASDPERVISVKHLINAPDTQEGSAEATALCAKFDQLNNRFAVVKVAGSVGVADLSSTPPDLLSSAAFNTLYQNKVTYFHTKNGRRETSVPSLWLKWRYRRDYDGGLLFAPGKPVPANQLNLFQGFATEPIGRNWEFLEAHIRDNVCSGDPKLFEWLMSWFADIVQNPGQKPGTAVCLRGKKGTGKSIVFDMFRKLIGLQYTTVIASKKHLTGNFNKHLATALFAQVEEAVWAGDKEGEGQLKHLITSERLPIEPKGFDRFEVDNFTRFGFTTNEDWALPASADERRYLILDVSDAQMQNSKYFEHIVAQMENGDGLGAWMKALMEWQKPDWVDLRNPPKTDALGEQVLESLPVPQKFFVEEVQTGSLFSDSGATERTIEEIYPAYENFVQERGAKMAATRNKFGASLKKVWGFEQEERRVNGIKTRVYFMPSLDEARAIVAENLSISVNLLK